MKMTEKVEKLVSHRNWENIPASRQILCVSGDGSPTRMSLAALNQAFACVEAEASRSVNAVDAVIMSEVRLDDVWLWGIPVSNEKGGVRATVFGAGVYAVEGCPDDKILVASFEVGQKKTVVSSVTIVPAKEPGGVT